MKTQETPGADPSTSVTPSSSEIPPASIVVPKTTFGGGSGAPKSTPSVPIPSASVGDPKQTPRGEQSNSGRPVKSMLGMSQ